MTTAEASAIICGAVEGTALTHDEKSYLARSNLAGITLFKRNISERHEEVRHLLDELTAAVSPTLPLIFAVDQEGGRVARFRGDGFPEFGPAMGLAGGEASEDALAEIRHMASQVGAALLAMGVNVNFAPVVDVLSEAANDAIGDRAFGVDPDSVARRAGAYLEGLQGAGVLGCLKHFPGQGAAKIDTHEGTAVVEVSASTLAEREVAPFRRLLKDVPMVMVAHCIYPSLAPMEASRSSAIIDGLLRRDLGFAGVVVSDDMNMKAIPQDTKDWQDALIESVVAGVDLVLVCRHLDRMVAAEEAFAANAARSPAFAKRLSEAAAKVQSLRRQLRR